VRLAYSDTGLTEIAMRPFGTCGTCGAADALRAGIFAARASSKQGPGAADAGMPGLVALLAGFWVLLGIVRS